MSTTTQAAIRDQCILMIAAIAPRSNSGDKFVAYPSNADGEFVPWAESTPDGAFRRFFVRATGSDKPVEVSNTDIETHYTELEVMVAYPKTARTGTRGALDRDDVIDQDRFLIEHAIGLLGAANFVTPAATYRGHTVKIDRTSAVCDYLILVQTMSYARLMS